MLTWPLALDLRGSVPGIPNVDVWDTAWLRLAVARDLLSGEWPVSREVHFPVGYPVGALVPNYVDHLTGAPFALLLPWPLGDNLWWLLVLAANGLAGHVLGRALGGTHRHGALVGIGFATADAVLREANLGHGPSAMNLFAPLFVLALLRTLAPEGRTRDAVAAGVLIALAGLTYWYQVLFLVLLGLPVTVQALVARPAAVLRRMGIAAGVALALVALPLALTLSGWEDLPNTGGMVMPDLRLGDTQAIPEPFRWTFAHAGDLLWPLRPTPLDRSNRLPLALLGAAVVGGLCLTRGRRWPWVVAALLGGILVMGPYLKLGEDPVLVGGQPIPLPGRLLAGSELLARLTWPQRWGLVPVLALLPLAARAPRPLAWAAAALLEALLLSGNAPLHTSSVAPLAGWRNLAAAEGAVLVLPLDRAGTARSLLGFVYRATDRPLATPVEIAPGAPEPGWLSWQRTSGFSAWISGIDPTYGAGPLAPAALAQLREDGIDAVALDVTPGMPIAPSRLEPLQRALEQELGPPVDYGSALVWWLVPPPGGAPPGLQDGDAWREQMEAELARERPVSSRTIVPPFRRR